MSLGLRSSLDSPSDGGSVPATSHVRAKILGLPVRVHQGVVQGIRSILVATELATLTFQVDSELATRGVGQDPWASARLD